LKKKCTRCRWYKNKYVNCTSFFGNPNADIIFCGEAFGKNEALAGEAFVGKAGNVFDDLLRYAGLNREDVAIMNAMRCYLEGNPTPTKSELDNCFIYSYNDIQNIDPKLVIAMGGSALYQMTGKEGVEKYRGRMLWSDKIQRKVFVTNHPAATIYDRTKLKDLKKDFKKIPKLMYEEVQDIKHYSYKYAEDENTAIKLLSELDIIDNELYFDIETTGLSPYYNDITLLQLGNKNSEVVIIDGKVLDSVNGTLAEMFDKYDVIGQDYSFDSKFLSTKLSILPKNWKHDTCLAEFLLTGMKDNDLTYLTYKYVPESFGYDDDVIKAGGAHKVKSKEKLLQYACDDVGVLPKIKAKQYEELLKKEQLWFFENIMMPCNKVLTKMVIRGIKYDIDELNIIDSVYADKAQKLMDAALQLDGIKEYERKFKKRFNPRSYDMVRWLLLDYYQLPVIKKTKVKKQPSLGKNEMKKYSEEFNNEYCKIMEKYRSLQNIRSNFLSGVKDKLVDGVAHTTYSLHAAATGRPNSKDPNCLNIPPNIRSIIVPRKGHMLLHADLSQIEVRIAAVIYDDSDLLKITNDVNADFHSMIAAKAFGFDYNTFLKRVESGDKKAKEIRRVAKTISFGVLYQETAWGLAYSLGISEEEAQRFIDEYFAAFPRLASNIEKTKQHVIKYGYVRNPFGFIRRWKFHSKDDTNVIREATNQPIQSSAWNLMQLILIQVDEYLEDKRSKLIMQTYDDLVIEAYKTEIEEIAYKVKDIIENINKPFVDSGLNRVKILADIELGVNLNELRKYI